MGMSVVVAPAVLSLLMMVVSLVTSLSGILSLFLLVLLRWLGFLEMVSLGSLCTLCQSAGLLFLLFFLLAMLEFLSMLLFLLRMLELSLLFFDLSWSFSLLEFIFSLMLLLLLSLLGLSFFPFLLLFLKSSLVSRFRLRCLLSLSDGVLEFLFGLRSGIGMLELAILLLSSLGVSLSLLSSKLDRLFLLFLMLLGLSLLCLLFLFPSAILAIGSKGRLFFLNWLWLAELGLFMLEFALLLGHFLLMFPETELIISHLAGIRRTFAYWLSRWSWFSWGFRLSLRGFFRLLERMSQLMRSMF